MKVAEALQLRADLNRRIAQLGERLNANALVQEGESTPEDPKALLRELEESVKTLEELMYRINLSNAGTRQDGKPVTEMIAHRDALRVKIERYRSLISAASQGAYRASRTEIKILPAVDVKALQKQLDALSRDYRETDNAIQALNWSTELPE
jgi:outer membrane murein-binding lipoprotein Lpp